VEVVDWRLQQVLELSKNQLPVVEFESPFQGPRIASVMHIPQLSSQLIFHVGVDSTESVISRFVCQHLAIRNDDVEYR
jgi:hypothetical protein